MFQKQEAKGSVENTVALVLPLMKAECETKRRQCCTIQAFFFSILVKPHISGTALTQCKDSPFKPTIHYIPICFTDETLGGLSVKKGREKI